MFLLWLRQLPRCGDQTPASVSPPAEGRSSPTNTPVFPPVPSSYGVLRGSICSFTLVRYSCRLSGGVLHALLCLKYIPDVSVWSIFLMYQWIEMYSTSTYSSAILFSKTQIVIFQYCLVEHFCYFSKVSFLRETFLRSSTNICSLRDITSPLMVLT